MKYFLVNFFTMMLLNNYANAAVTYNDYILPKV